VCNPSTLPCPFVTTWGSTGSGDGEFNLPQRIAVDTNGNVFVTDTACCGGNTRIQKFDNNGTFLTKWGSEGTGDGQFDGPIGIGVDEIGNVFITDTNNNRIQKFDNGGKFLAKWGSAGSGDGEFNVPIDVAVDRSGHVFVADANNHRIQKFDNNGLFITAWGSRGGGEGRFNYVIGVAVERSSGDVFVADGNQRIQRFTNTGTFLARWDVERITGLAVDARGNVFVAQGERVQKFTNTGFFLAEWGCPGSGVGQFNLANHIAVDGSSNVFVADSSNGRIQKFACPL
jgi:hypothetical protein